MVKVTASDGNGGTVSDTFTLTVNKAPGVTVTPAALVVEKRAEETYDIVLDTAPTGDVEITPTSSAETTATVDPTTLIFTASNWNKAQQVTVTGAEAGSANISHTVSSSADTTNYPRTMRIDSVAVTVRALPRVSFALPSIALSESGTYDVEVDLSPAPASNITLSYTVDAAATAAAGSDYTPLSGEVAVKSGAALARIPIAITNDKIDEADETIILTLTDGTGYDLGGPTTHTLTILDNDPTPTLTIAPPSVKEGNRNAKVLTFRATLSGPSSRRVTVDYADLETGTATPAADYAPLQPGRLTIAPGRTAARFSVMATGDRIDERDETVIVRFSAPVNAAFPADAAATLDVVGTILDNEITPVTLAGSEDALAEGAAKDFTVTLGRPLYPGESAFYNLTYGGTAMPGVDYAIECREETRPFRVFCPSRRETTDVETTDQLRIFGSEGGSATSVTLTLTARYDGIDEADGETVNIGIALVPAGDVVEGGGIVAAPTDTFGTFTIEDAPPNPVSLSISDGGAALEGDPGPTITATLDNPAGADISIPIQVNTASSTAQEADYALPTSISIISGSKTGTEILTVTNDTADELPETVVVDLGATLPPGIAAGAAASVTATITDDDPTIVSLARADSGAVTESGSDKAEFTVTLGRALVAGERVDVPLVFSGAGIEASDFTLAKKSGASLNMGVLLRRPGRRNPTISFEGSGAQTATLEIGAQVDHFDEGQGETLTVSLGSKRRFDADGDTNVGGGAAPSATENTFGFDITDDDTAGITVSETALTLDEAGGTAAYTLVLTSAPLRDVTIKVTSRDRNIVRLDGPDASEAFRLGEKVTFTPENWRSAQTITIQARDDNVVNSPARRTTITHAIASDEDGDGDGYTAATPEIADLEVTLTDDESMLAFDIDDTFLVEGGRDAGLSMTYTGTGTDLSIPGTGLFAFSGDGITTGDYRIAENLSVSQVFSAPKTGKSYTLKALDDGIDEPDEEILIGFGAGVPSRVLKGPPVTLRIVDQDPTSVILARIGSGEISEAGGIAEFTVTLGRGLIKGETITAPLVVTGSNVMSDDYSIRLKSGAALNTGVTLNTSAPYSTAKPAIIFTGEGSDPASSNVTMATLELIARPDTVTEGTETVTLALIQNSPVIVPRSNLDCGSGIACFGIGGTR
ncbi:MAG: hypothetical protein F4Z40_03580, partial [Chloroflexi bacterium]|nr:hypothetical protein [Chloroflexota bacterium]